MTIEELAHRERDVSRALYIQLVAGKVDGYAFQLISEMRDILDGLEKKLSYYQMSGSDLKGLAEREKEG